MRLAAGMKTGARDAVHSRMYEVVQFRTARASK
jgi:hypothetical protein